jgi:predicted O-methyltransferase YrrM
MVETGNRRFAVPEADGRRLRLLAESLDAKNVVEVGTSTGYSALWLGMAVAGTGGRVTTFDSNEQTAANARQNFLRAGMDSNITVITGDAHKNLAALKPPVDLVFLDADKEGYVDYLNKLTPLVRPGGLIVAHNVDAAPDYLQRVTTDPQFDTVRLTEGSGLTVTLKKR